MAEFDYGELVGKHVLLYVENDDTPDQFDRVCFFQLSGEMSRSKNYSTYTTRPCTDPDAKPVERKSLQTSTGQITGSFHVVDKAAFVRLQKWHDEDLLKKIQLRAHEKLAMGKIGAEAFRWAATSRLTLPNLSFAYDGPVVASGQLDPDGDFVFDDLSGA